MTSPRPPVTITVHGRPAPQGSKRIRDLEAALAAEQARAERYRLLAAEILSHFHQGSDGYRGRVGQVQIARWQQRLDGTP